MKIKLHDNSFYGDAGCSKFYAPTKFSWFRGIEKTSGDNNLVVYTDNCLPMVDIIKGDVKKIALLIEPYVISPNSYHYIADNYKKFDMILSHHHDLARIGAKWYPFGSTWISKEDHKAYKKSKNISIIASGKNYAPGHILRNQVVSRVKDSVDVYGYAFNPIKYKLDALKDYRFSIAIENCQVPLYWTEKLQDCFVTHTIPIYYGSEKISDIFNPKGMFFANTIHDFERVVTEILNSPEEIYEAMFPAVKENFEIAKKYLCAEDWLYDNVFVDLLKEKDGSD